LIRHNLAVTVAGGCTFVAHPAIGDENSSHRVRLAVPYVKGRGFRPLLPTTGRYLETTDDAFVKADSTIIAPKVSGYISDVLVSDNEPAKAGQLLARIDDRDFRTALNQACADVAASEAAVKNLNAQIELQEPLIRQQAAEVDAAEANLKFAQQERTRYDDLMKSGSGTLQRAQQTDAALRAQTAQLLQGKAGLDAANKKIEVLSSERAKAVAQLAHARAVEQQAALNLSYT
jgi:membrane fusion protein (multidrug efflux system)